MNKVILKILVILSIIIIICGIFAGKNVKFELQNETGSIGDVYVDGTDFTDVTELFAEIGSGLLGFVIIIYSILAVACIWAIYGIALLIVIIIKKCKAKREKIKSKNESL